MEGRGKVAFVVSMSGVESVAIQGETETEKIEAMELLKMIKGAVKLIELIVDPLAKHRRPEFLN